MSQSHDGGAVDMRDADASELDAPESIALGRLIDEVRNDSGLGPPTAYNRTYHRHNR